MGNLNEQVTTVVRKTWDRSNRVVIKNDYNSTPKVTFEIQTVTTDNDVLVGSSPKSIMDIDFDPTLSYPLINPIDNSVISETGGNHMMLQIQLYSLFQYLTRG